MSASKLESDVAVAFTLLGHLHQTMLRHIAHEFPDELLEFILLHTDAQTIVRCLQVSLLTRTTPSIPK